MGWDSAEPDETSDVQLDSGSSDHVSLKNVPCEEMKKSPQWGVLVWCKRREI